MAERREWAASLACLDTKAGFARGFADLSAIDVETWDSMFELGAGKSQSRLCLLVHAFFSDNDGGSSHVTAICWNGCLGVCRTPIWLLGGMQNSSWLKERLDVVAGVWEACEWPSGALVEMGTLRLGSTDAGSG